MDDISKDMKTEKDFIEKMEASSKVESETPVKSAADIEREAMQREMKIKSKEENSVSNNISTKEKKPSTKIEYLQASPITSEASDNLNKDTEPEITITHINLELTAKRPTDDDAPWVEEQTSKLEEKEIKEEEVPKEPEPRVESKPKKVKKAKEVSVVSAAEAAVIEESDNNKNNIGIEVIEDDMDQRVRDENIEIRKINEAKLGEYEDDEELTTEKVIETFNNNYEDSEVAEESEDKKVEIIDEKKSDVKGKEQIKESIDNISEEPREKNYYGGDGVHTSFKIRTAKVAKVLRNIKLDDTDSITATDISKKTQKEQQNIYMTTVLPTLQPSYSVIPFVISGVVITMTAFQWVDIKEICKIDEKVDDLDPSSEDYIYNKNLLFLEKREKQMDIFYRHIYSVSGYETKPSKHKLYSEIIKFPDFQQLFFAAYVATFQKPTTIGLTCATCGATHDLTIGSKDLCFLLNKHIEYDKLNKYIEKGAISGSSTAEVYEQFQKEKIVESANKTYRIQQKLPISSFVYQLEVPYVEQAYTALAEIIEKFRDKPLEYVDEDTEQIVCIDSTFGLPDYLIELRKYLYLKSLMVPHIIDDGEDSVKVSYINFTDLDGIIDSVYNLSPEDYNALMDDPRLNSIMNISGIRHLIDGKQCPEESCGAELGLLPVEPETLFFMIARRK